MTDDMRFRKPDDHNEAVGFCLQVAATNSALLARHANEKSALDAALNPLAYSTRMTVEGALKAAAAVISKRWRNDPATRPLPSSCSRTSGFG